jgi:polysaccharide chain length determinant protein (PEP-CTERM system associated)
VPTKEVENISVHNLLAVIWRRKLAIALPTLLLTAAFTVYAYHLPERYAAQALLAIDPQANPPNVQIPTVEEQLWNVRDTVLGRPLVEKVIAEFKLQSSTPDIVEDVKSRINIDVVSAKSFHVGFQGEDPELVAHVANRLSELFVSQTTNAQTRTIAQANGLLNGELESLRAKLSSQNEQIQNYKEKVGSALPERLDTNLKAIDVLEDRIQRASAAIATGEAARAAAVKEMSELEKRGALDPAVSKDQSPGQRKVDELKLDLAKARAKYTEKNPEVVSLAKQVKDLEKNQPQAERGRAEPSAVSLRYVQLSAELEGIEQRLQSEHQELNSLTSKLQTDRGQVASAPQHENEMALLMRDRATTQESYNALLAKQNVVAADGADRVNRGLIFTIAEAARPPLVPYSPRRARITLMGIFAGLCLGGLIAFGAEQLTTSFRNAEEFAAFTSLPVLAEVPAISKRNGGRTKAGRVVTVKQPTSVAAELYFTLATRVRQRCQEQSRDEQGKGRSAPSVSTTARNTEQRTQPSSVVLAITSATGGEGKTLTSLNLSIALAKSFRGKVLLVDADLRRPMLHEYLELTGAGQQGFGDLLLNPEDDIHKYILEYNGLSVMPTFRRVPNPIGMLASDSARALLERMSLEFAFIVLDSPPIVPMADGHVLASLADHVLLIARARRTPRELFKLAVESLDCSNVIGVALNDVDLKHSRYSSAYHYYQDNYQVRE